MPFDVRDFPGAPPEERASGRRDRTLVAGWLLAVCAMIGVMIVLGGVTRLTGSGLSIMEWAPLRGALPPMSEPEWQRLFDLYRRIPQYALVNEGFGIEGFKRIFWLEWAHRLWGRLIGVVFLLPLVAFWATGRIERRLRPRLAAIFLLGGLQGAVGWFMVASGFFPDTTAVSPYRLVIHLVLALVLFAAIFWTALGILRPVGRAGAVAPWLRTLAMAAAGAVGLTIVAGGFVAGIHAGLDYNTFPLMDGRLVPEGYAALSPLPRNWTENVAAVQFDHRLLATLTAILTLGTAVSGFGTRARTGSVPGLRAALLALAAAVGVQYCLGVATLLAVVPPALAAAHQAVAVLALAAALATLHALRRPARRMADGAVMGAQP
jgi:cytochrome c oxidase assembly protein subunit 15